MNRYAALLLLLVEYLIVSVSYEAGPTPFGTLAALFMAIGASLFVFAPSFRRAVWAPAFAVPRWALAVHAGSFLLLLAALRAGFFLAGGWRAATGLAFAAATATTLFGPSVAWRTIRLGRAVTAAALGALTFVVADAFDAAWSMFSTTTLKAVAWLMAFTPWDVITQLDDRIIGTTFFVVAIHPSCAGTEGLGLMVMFVGGGLAWFRRELRWPHAFLLLPLGLVLVSAANVIRIVALIAIGHAGAPELALGGFHSRAGWVAFTTIAIGIVLIGRTKMFRTAPSTTRSHAVLFHLLPLAALLIPTLVVPLFATDTDLVYVASAIAASIAAIAVGVHRHLQFDRHIIAPILLGTIVYLGWSAVEPSGAPEPARFSRWLLHASASTLLVPVVEELAFRGYLMRRLVGRRFESIAAAAVPTWAVVVSAVGFGLVHGRILPAIGAGLVYAWIYRRRGRVEDAIVAHAVTNALIAAEVLFFDHWFLW